MMCRGKAECPELGNDPDRWDRYCPLRPPTWFEGQLDIFISAVNEFVDVKQARCIDILSTIRSDEMRDWFIEHGLPSGKHRARVLKKPKPVFLAKELRDPLRSPKRYEAEVFQRDGYRCRYCGIRLVSNKLLKALIKKLNIETFSRHSKTYSQTGLSISSIPLPTMSRHGCWVEKLSRIILSRPVAHATMESSTSPSSKSELRILSAESQKLIIGTA